MNLPFGKSFSHHPIIFLYHYNYFTHLNKYWDKEKCLREKVLRDGLNLETNLFLKSKKMFECSRFCVVLHHKKLRVHASFLIKCLSVPFLVIFIFFLVFLSDLIYISHVHPRHETGTSINLHDNNHDHMIKI